MNKKALALSELGKWLLFIVFLLVLVVLIYSFGRKSSSILDSILNVFRFGR